MAALQLAFKMASVTEVRSKQKAVIKFLLAEKETVTNIHRRLRNVYGDLAVDKSTVSRWVKRLSSSEEGKQQLSDLPRSGRPPTALTPAVLQRAETLIRDDRRITTRQLAAQLGIAIGSVSSIVHQLGYSKVCARWVPRSLTDDHKEQRKITCTELLARYEADGDDFLSCIVTGDETWVHHYEPETKRQSMEWHRTTSPRKKKFKTTPSAGKVMATVFWDSEGVILIDVLPHGETINSEVYVQTLKKLKKRFQRVRSHKDVNKLLLLHDNARPHTSLYTREEITKLHWTVLPHPPYSPDLAPSDFYLFGPLKDAIRGKRYGNDLEVIDDVRSWLRHRPVEWYRAGIQALISRWRKAIDLNGDYVEK